MPVAKKIERVKKPEIVSEEIVESLKLKAESEIPLIVKEVEPEKNLVSMKPITKAEPLPVVAPRMVTPPPIAPIKPYIDPNVEAITGALDILPDGQGFVRPKFTPSPKDAMLPSMLIRRWGLRMGDIISGLMRVAKEGEKYNAMTSLQKVNGVQLSQPLRRPDFRDLVPVYAEKQIKLETEPVRLDLDNEECWCRRRKRVRRRCLKKLPMGFQKIILMSI